MAQFPHARDTFARHLESTFDVLHVWAQPLDVCRTGLFHTAYAGDLFPFYWLKSSDPVDRAALRDLVGEEAEAIVYAFGTVSRSVVNETIFNNGTLPAEGMELGVFPFDGGTRHFSARLLAQVLVTTIADFVEQAVEVNGWRDIHMHEHAERLYPGIGRPEMGLYWYSKVCIGIRDHLDVVPPIFDGCTVEVSYADERDAIDAYWKAAVLSDARGDVAEVQALLERAASLLPQVAEPRSMLAQVHFAAGDFALALEHAEAALELHYVWGAAWDKRMSFAQWVHFSRLLAYRAKRKLVGFHHSMQTDEYGEIAIKTLIEAPVSRAY